MTREDLLPEPIETAGHGLSGGPGDYISCVNWTIHPGGNEVAMIWWCRHTFLTAIRTAQDARNFAVQHGLPGPANEELRQAFPTTNWRLNMTTPGVRTALLTTPLWL